MTVRCNCLLARQRSRLPEQRREVLLVLLGRSEGVDVNRVVRCCQQALVDKALAAVLGLECEVGREHANTLLVQRPPRPRPPTSWTATQGRSPSRDCGTSSLLNA